MKKYNLFTSLVLVVSLLQISKQFECPTGCSSCSADYVCSGCNSGYELVSNKCVPCPQNCGSCSSGVCTSSGCNNPSTYVAASGKCLQCVQNCQTCNEWPTSCSQCSALLTVNSVSKKCELDTTNCPVYNCADCQNIVVADTNTPKMCIACTSNYYAYDGTCNLCPFTCLNCQLPLQSAYTATIQPVINQYLQLAYSGATYPSDITTYYKMHNMFDIHLLIQIINPGSDTAKKQSIADKLKSDDYLIFTSATTIDSFKKLSNLQKANFLNQLLNVTIYSAENIHQKLSQQIVSNTPRLLTCSSCYSEYVVASNECVACQPGCSICTNPTACSTCKDGYYWSGSSCVRCTSPCLTCTDTGTTACTSCAAPYTILSTTNTCGTCNIANCDTCSANGQSCITCAKPYSSLPGANGCYRCNDNLCLHCDSANTSRCIQCSSGSVLNANAVCVSCPERCQTCVFNATTSAVSCRSCVLGYVLQDGVCEACPSGCVTCSVFDRQICLQCMDGMYINGNNKCAQCDRGCELCKQGGICTKLQSGHILYKNATTKCGVGCTRCDYTNPANCLQCQPGNYLNTDKCLKCRSNCLACTSATDCQQCAPNTHDNVTALACQSCSGNCLTCDSTDYTKCLTCRKGYTLNTTSNLCGIACGRGCVDCTDALCLQCDRGFALKSDGTCVRCLRGCSGTCDPKNITKCLGCANGFQLKYGVCNKCGPGCLTCQNQQCRACLSGFTLLQDRLGNYVCSKDTCKFPCIQCNSAGCTSCASGYVVSGGQCLTDISCSTTAPASCSSCTTGSYSSGVNTCARCPSGCYTCTSQDICMACLDGYYLNGNACTGCPSQCKTCTNGQVCGECSQGFIRDIVSKDQGLAYAQQANMCQMCSNKCKNCSTQADQCQACQDGYRLKDFECFGRNNVKFKHKFDTTFSSFLEQSKSELIISKIAQILNIDQNNIAIKGLSEGSTIMEGQISAGSQAQAIQIANTLYDTVKDNPNVLGFTALESSVGAYYDDIQTHNAGGWRNIAGIIIGCAIAVAAIILIVLVVVWICRKVRGSREEHYDGEQSKERVAQEYNNQLVAYNYDVPQAPYLKTGENNTFYQLKPVHY